MNKYLVYVLIATIIISTAPIFSQIGVPNKGVWVFSFYTLFSAFVSILIYSLIKKKKLKFSKKFILPAILSGLGALFFFYSFNFISGISVGFLSQSQLVITLIISYFLLNEKLNSKKIIASALVIIGSFVIYYQESLDFNQTGVLTIFLAMIFFSLTNYLVKKLRNKYDTLSINFYKTLIASMILLIPCLIFSSTELITLDVNVFYAFCQGFLADFLGWTLFIYSLKHVKLNTAFIIFSLSSIFTLIYSFLIFGINLILLQLIGGALIIIGNIIFNK